MYSKTQLCLKIRGFTLLESLCIGIRVGETLQTNKNQMYVRPGKYRQYIYTISSLSYFLLRSCFHLVSKLQTHKT